MAIKAELVDTRDIWVTEYQYVRKYLFHKLYASAKQVIAVDGNDTPRMFSEDDCFESEREACSAFAAKKMSEAMEFMNKANEYSLRASGAKTE